MYVDGGLLSSRHLLLHHLCEKVTGNRVQGSCSLLPQKGAFSLRQGKETFSGHLINSVNCLHRSFSFMPQLLTLSSFQIFAQPSLRMFSDQLLHLQIRLWVEPHLCLLVQSRHKASEAYTVGSCVASKTTKSCFHLIQTGSLSSHGEETQTVKQWKERKQRELST